MQKDDRSNTGESVSSLYDNVKSKARMGADRFGNISDVCSKLGSYCKNHTDERIKVLPRMMETICNISDDPRSDWYVQTLCNTAFSAFVLEARNDDASLINVFSTVSSALFEIENKCGFRLVMENIPERDGSSMSIEDHIYHDKENNYLDTIGFNGFVNDFGKRYDFEKQKEEYSTLKRNIVILYAKIVERGGMKNLSGCFSDEEVFYILSLLAERGFSTLEMGSAPNRYCLATVFSQGIEINDYASLSVFDTLMGALYECSGSVGSGSAADVIWHITNSIHEIYCNPDASWKDKIYMNSAISYAVRQNRMVMGREPIPQLLDFIYLMVLGFHQLLSGNGEAIMKDWTYDFLRSIGTAEEECKKTFVGRYGDACYLDLCMRSYMSETQATLSWHGLRNDDYLEYISEKSWSILPLVRELDKKSGKDPKYKNRQCLNASLDLNGIDLVEEMERKLDCRGSVGRRNNRNIRRAKFDIWENVENEFTRP